MAKLQWDQANEKIYETGVKEVVLYVKDPTSGGRSGYGAGVAWNGVTGITESPSGADITKLYANDGVYANLQAAEEFGGTIEAYTYPDEFAECDGSATPVPGMKLGQQTRKVFGLSYKTTVGNDSQGNNYGYKLHLVYGCLATPSERSYATMNESPEAITFSWEFQSTPEATTYIKDATGKYLNLKPTSIITIDSKDYIGTEKEEWFKSLEATLHGEPGIDVDIDGAYLPTPYEVWLLLSKGPENTSEDPDYEN